MTCDERLEKLLNRAGQTISDLPKPSDYCYAYDVNNPEISHLVENTVREFCQLEEDCGTGIRAYHDYILHLTDVIDRLEWALDKTVRERDYLISEYVGCECCTYGADAKTFDEEPCASCVNEEHFEWNIPENWRADNV